MVVLLCEVLSLELGDDEELLLQMVTLQRFPDQPPHHFQHTVGHFVLADQRERLCRPDGR